MFSALIYNMVNMERDNPGEQKLFGVLSIFKTVKEPWDHTVWEDCHVSRYSLCWPHAGLNTHSPKSAHPSSDQLDEELQPCHMSIWDLPRTLYCARHASPQTFWVEKNLPRTTGPGVQVRYTLAIWWAATGFAWQPLFPLPLINLTLLGISRCPVLSPRGSEGSRGSHVTQIQMERLVQN